MQDGPTVGLPRDKGMVEQSHTNPESICKEYLNHPLGLTLSTPGLVCFNFRVQTGYLKCHPGKVKDDHINTDINIQSTTSYITGTT